MPPVRTSDLFWRRFRWPFDPVLLLPVFTTALLLLAGNDDFGFDPAGWLDPFMYLYYFWHYPEHTGALAVDYKSSRLPWILPGFAAHTLLGPVAASYLLAFATLSAGGIAIYLIARDTVESRTAAAVCGVAWTACTWVHGPGGWNYHMLAAADYFLFASWLAFRAGTRGALWSALSGVCAAAAVHTHLLFALFVPLLALTYWSGSSDGEPRQRYLRAGGAFMLGAVALTVVLAATNLLSGGDLLFFMPQLAQARRLAAHDNWWLPAAAWLPTATYLVVPAAFAVGGLVGILRRLPDRGWRVAGVLVLQAWLAWGLLCVAQFVRQQATLNSTYLEFPLYVFAFPSAAVLLAGGGLPHADTTSRLGAHTGRGIGPIVAYSAIVVAPLLASMPSTLPRLLSTGQAWSRGVPPAPVVLPLVFALAGVIAISTARAALRPWLFAIWFGVLNAWIAPAPTAYGFHTPGYRRAMLELFREADGLTSAFDPTLGGVKYWWAGGETLSGRFGTIPAGWVFDSLVATRGWQANLLAGTGDVPLRQLTLEQLDRARCVAVLSSRQSSGQTEAALQTHFAGLGRPLHRVTLRHLASDGLAFDLVLLQAVDLTVRRGPPCVPPR